MEIQELLEKLKDGFDCEQVDGKLVLTPKKKESELMDGFWVNNLSKILYSDGFKIKHSYNKNLFPTKSAAEWFGLIMPQLLQKYKELIGDWKPEGMFYTVFFNVHASDWIIYHNQTESSVGVEFPFPHQQLAEKFLEENLDLLNKIKEVQYT
jgi:hypothetical protein